MCRQEEGGVSEVAPEVERHYQREIRTLKQQLAAEKRASAQLRSTVVSTQTGRAELEEFFLRFVVCLSISVAHARSCRCIESTKRQIMRRKKKAALASDRSVSVNLGQPRVQTLERETPL